MKRLKIIHCLVFFLPNRVGGIEIYVNALSKGLIKRGHEVKILVPDYPGENLYSLTYDDIPILTYQQYLNTSKQEFRGNIPGAGLKDFINALKNENPDIVHFHQLTSSNGISVFHIQAAKDLGYRVIYTNHLASFTCQTGRMTYRNNKSCDGVINPVKCTACDLQRNNINEPISKIIANIGHTITTIFPAIQHLDSNSKLVQLLFYSNLISEKREKVEKVLALVDGFIVLTEWYYQVLHNNGLMSDKIKVIKQAIPSQEINVGKKRETQGFPIRLIYAGRIFPDKGLLILLSALKGLDESKVSLDIYGQEDAPLYYRTCLALCKGKSNIKWHNHINYKDMPNTMSAYDVLILPSMVAEMAPLVIQEAFAIGLPIIGTNVGGIAEEIKPGINGFVFEMGNVKALKDILQKLINEPSMLTAMSQQIQLSKPRSFEEVVRETEVFYNSLV